MNRAWLALGFAVALNAFTLLGVLVWGWPPGNVYLLFWVENVVIGAATLPRIVTARGTGPAATINNRPASPVALALFFVVHYGIFCLVHGAFTAFVAYRSGYALTFAYLGLPVIFLLIRYAVETATSWFGPDGQRWSVSPSQAATQPYARIIVLHLAVMAAFALSLADLTDGRVGGEWYRYVRPVLDLLPDRVATPGVLAVLILVVVKSVVDVITTRRAVRPR